MEPIEVCPTCYRTTAFGPMNHDETFHRNYGRRWEKRKTFGKYLSTFKNTKKYYRAVYWWKNTPIEKPIFADLKNIH